MLDQILLQVINVFNSTTVVEIRVPRPKGELQRVMFPTFQALLLGSIAVTLLGQCTVIPEGNIV